MSSDKKDYTKLEDFTEDTDYSQFFRDLPDDEPIDDVPLIDDIDDTDMSDVYIAADSAEYEIKHEIKPKKNTKKSKKKNLAKNTKKSADRGSDARTTSAILISIMTVGVCLLGVAFTGIFATVNKMKQSGEQPVNADSQQVLQQEFVQPSTTSAAQPQTTSGQNNTIAPATPVDTSDSDVSGVPKTDAEWLEFFNTAVNKLKTDGPSFAKDKQTVTADIQLSNPLGQAYVSTIKDKFLSDDTVITEIAKGDTAAAVQNVSPDGASYVSALSMSDIKSITHSADNDGNYVIRIDMNDAVSPTMADPYGRIFQFMLVDDVMNTYAPDIGATVDRENAELRYSGCYAAATVTPDGKLVTYQTYVCAHMILKSAKISVITTDLDAELISNTVYRNIVW